MALLKNSCAAVSRSSWAREGCRLDLHTLAASASTSPRYPWLCPNYLINYRPPSSAPRENQDHDNENAVSERD
eukprot:970735-Rhodomonas_salina.2